MPPVSEPESPTPILNTTGITTSKHNIFSSLICTPPQTSSPRILLSPTTPGPQKAQNTDFGAGNQHDDAQNSGHRFHLAAKQNDDARCSGRSPTPLVVNLDCAARELHIPQYSCPGVQIGDDTAFDGFKPFAQTLDARLRCSGYYLIHAVGEGRMW
ncbi:hypothetical protein B0H17DRAFT_1133632 [Mycena rosella]|uniref:Uncharacterized protein n=1 Tax=Mycena rosella TaxID=1033263 RepID=A0AAD7DHB0_MYCRO|nr:hypothetical protein B0H17DRAFT_1133632 [Mycena rosella]